MAFREIPVDTETFGDKDPAALELAANVLGPDVLTFLSQHPDYELLSAELTEDIESNEGRLITAKVILRLYEFEVDLQLQYVEEEGYPMKTINLDFSLLSSQGLGIDRYHERLSQKDHPNMSIFQNDLATFLSLLPPDTMTLIAGSDSSRTRLYDIWVAGNPELARRRDEGLLMVA